MVAFVGLDGKTKWDGGLEHRRFRRCPDHLEVVPDKLTRNGYGIAKYTFDVLRGFGHMEMGLSTGECAGSIPVEVYHCGCCIRQQVRE